MASPNYTLGLDYGTNSVRTIIVNVANGKEIATAVWNYAHGTHGVILSRDPNLARQHPQDYVTGAETTIKAALAAARKTVRGFNPSQIIGIGVDTTGSTPLPVNALGQPLAFDRRFANDPAAMAWLWKDHTGVAEAGEITALARKIRPQYLAKCGGTYSSEWFFSKVLHCLRTSPKVFDAAYSWVECSDWVPAMLTGTEAPEKLMVGVCAAGHKAMYNDDWGGYPDAEFLSKLHPKLGELRAPPPPQGVCHRPGCGWTDRCMGEAHRLAGGHSGGGRRVRRAPRRRRLRHRAGCAGQDHRHQHLRHDGGAGRGEAGGRARACAASSTAASCRVTMAWRPGNQPWATFSTGS